MDLYHTKNQTVWPFKKSRTSDEALLMQDKTTRYWQTGLFLEPCDLFSELAQEETQAEKQFHSGRLSQSTHALSKVRWVLRAKTILETYLLIWFNSQTRKIWSRKNELIVKVLVHLDEIDFDLENTDSDVLGDAWISNRTVCQWRRKESRFYTHNK
jgi:type I restriction enzyme M protein